jgi:hypothetical protein
MVQDAQRFKTIVALGTNRGLHRHFGDRRPQN